MRRSIVLATLVQILAVPPMVAAQTPAASPVAGSWAVTDSRDISVYGEPIALSPDGQWLAGTAEDGSAVCAWDVDTLTPMCAEVETIVRPYLGNTTMRWAPDSSAFAFASGDLARVIPMDVHVFDVGSGALTNLTNTGEGGPLYLGTAWTDDSQQVVFGVNHGLGGSVPDEVVRVNRSGGELVEVPLPDWGVEHEILFPPLVAGDTVFATIQAESEIGGVWKVGLDGSNPQQLVSVTGNAPVTEPFAASASNDGRYLNIVSLYGLQTNQMEGTFFLFDVRSGNLMPLDSEAGLHFVSFAPGGDTGLMVREVGDVDRLHALDSSTGQVAPVANSPEAEPWLATIPAWAENDTVFLPNDQGGILVTLEPRRPT